MKNKETILCALLLSIFGVATTGCSDESAGNELPSAAVPAAEDCDSDDAHSRCLTPKFDADYYTEQSSMYFDTLDADAPRDSIPNYSELVARWEWPPWLKLTGIGRDIMIQSDLIVVEATPSTVPERDCRFFDTQPFGRCRISFHYSGGPCPIYEEFTFSDQGEMTFIEAWSDQPGMLPFADPADLWGEGEGVNRLSTKIPGLGNATGMIDLDGAALQAAADADPDIADFLHRANNFFSTWSEELNSGADELTEEEIYGYGCGW